MLKILGTPFKSGKSVLRQKFRHLDKTPVFDSFILDYGHKRIYLSISFGSINTGLPKDIVQQLMKAERAPIEKLEIRKEKLGNKKALVNQLTSLVNKLRTEVLNNSNAQSLREVMVETEDGIVKVDLDKNVVQPGTHQIEVLNLAQRSTATTTGFEDPSESYIGVGYLRYITTDGEQKDIYIGPESANLNGLAALINRTPESGLKATVINDGSDTGTPWRLNLSLSDTGDGNRVEWPDFYLIDGDEDLYIENQTDAKDAKIKFNGFEMEVPTNKLKSLIPGAVINLKRAKAGEEFSINIKEDSTKITDKIGSLIKNINDVLNFIKQQNAMDETTDTTMTLGGDLILQTLESRIRGVIFNPIQTPDGSVRIGDLGVKFEKSGLLKFNPQQFEKVTSENYQRLSNFFVGMVNEDGEKVNGFIDNLKKLTDDALQYPNGLLKSRSKTIESNMSRIDRQIAQKERFLKQKEENLKAKFSRLESTISNIKSQGAGLAALSSATPNPVQQLG